MTRLEIFHLFQRSGFGLSPLEYEKVKPLSKSKIIDYIFDKANLNLASKVDLPEDYYQKKKNAEQGIGKDIFRKTDQKATARLGGLWLEKMADPSSSALLEKMSLFWHGHFACRPKKGILAVNYLNSIRKHSLGNFKDLLLAVSKDPAMLRFLNNQQNKKNAPNENFSRELLELFTLGRGQYSEEDIKECARAFTGWSSTPEGEFLFKRHRHDYGEKTFLNERGNFNGEEIINIILSKKACAEFLATKLYAFFVSDTPDSKHISSISDQIFDSNYNIEKTIRFMFFQDWFYNPALFGKKIKSPAELVVAQIKMLGLTFNKTSSIVFLMKLLGQVLLMPPNVAGWAGGRSWIDNSTLVVRVNLPYFLAKNIPPEIKAKGSLKDDKKNYASKRIDVSSNPKELLNWLSTHNSKRQTKELVNFLIPNHPELAKKQQPTASLLDQAISILGSLEFQLG